MYSLNLLHAANTYAGLFNKKLRHEALRRWVKWLSENYSSDWRRLREDIVEKQKKEWPAKVIIDMGGIKSDKQRDRWVKAIQGAIIENCSEDNSASDEDEETR